MLKPSWFNSLSRENLTSILSKITRSSAEHRALAFIKTALEKRVSDVHLELIESQSLLMRFRLDGCLHLIRGQEDFLLNDDSISLLKNFANINSEKDKGPQQGFFDVIYEDRLARIELSTLPLINGEKIVIHFVFEKKEVMNLRSLGMTTEQVRILQEKSQYSYGMIFVTGPAQSGVTSTIYAMLKRRMSPSVNILTLEDPVEKIIHGINQVQINADMGLTCAAGLRAFLRQDPDVVYSGAEQDEESLDVCIRAALTGRMLFSTLHALDASSALLSILGMVKSSPHLLAEGLKLIVNQRLLRRLCSQCKEVHDLDTHAKQRFKVSAPVIYKAHSKGCRDCFGTGYWGMTGIFELLTIDENLSSAIHRRAEIKEIKEILRDQPRWTLQQAAISKINEGVTSIEEALRVQL